MDIWPNDISDLEKVNALLNKLSIGLAVAAALCTWILYESGRKLESRQSQESARIQNETDLKIGVLSSETAEANKRAAEANLMAKSVENENLTLKDRVGSLSLRVHEEALKVEKEGLRRAEAEKQMVQLQIELQKKMSHRTINPILFRDIIAQFPKEKVEIVYDQNDIETYMLAQQIQLALGLAEWEILPLRAAGASGDKPFPIAESGFAMTNVSHIMVFVPYVSGMAEGNASFGITYALQQCGLSAARGFNNQNKPQNGTVRIVIGPRM